MVTASIITIGDELLIGQVIDTNSAWMAKQLNKAGISVIRRVAVGDEKSSIWNALQEEEKHADIILITGGLGPTSDDITKPILCSYFGGRLVVNEKVLEHVKYLYDEIFKRKPNAENLKQAEVPDVCTVIPNERGTAPGMWFEKEGKIFVSMPGVPYEMQGMVGNYVIENLKKRFRLPIIIHRTIVTSGVGESIISDLLKSFEEKLPSHIKLAYLPSYGMVRLRLSSSGIDNIQLASDVDEQFAIMKEVVLPYLVSEEDESLSEVVGKILLKYKKTISTAESCTGGYIAHLITAIPGCSNYYKGSIISYDNSIKSSLLEVEEQTLKAYGAVSEQTVKKMVKGVLTKLNTDYAIAVSGIMGPGGGTDEKPVGMVWIAVGNQNQIETRQLNLRFDRQKNIELTAQNGLDMIRKFILNDQKSQLL